MKINNSVIDALKNSNNVAIFVHINPDGDCLGSASALKEALLKLNKTADIYCDDEMISSNYNFIKHVTEINKPQNTNYDLAVAVDCSDLNRLGKLSELFKSIKNTIKIDHHKTQDNFAKINIIEHVSSCCLILYYYLNELLNKEFNEHIACSLYAGIASDTGSFLHSNTTYLEHEIAGRLLKYNFNLEELNYMLFKRRSLEQIMLLKIAYNNIKFYSDNKIAIIYLTKKDFTSTNTKRSDTTGITDIVTNIDGVQVGVTISEERKGLFSCSFRSKGNVDVSLVAEKFGGGGHERAAGCNIFGHLNTVIKKITDACSSQLK